MAILQKQLLSTSIYLLMYYIIEAAEVHFLIKVIRIFFHQKCVFFLQILATFFLVTIVNISIPTVSLPILVLH